MIEKRRSYKFRIYPTKEQEQLLIEWQHTLRFLWNICLAQRLMGLARTKEEKVYVSQLEQCKQMTELLEEYPWIAEVQCHARQKILADLDDAWRMCFKGLAGRPKFKGKKESPRIYIPSAVIKFTISSDQLLFRWGKAYKKLGPLNIILHRSIQGTIKSWSIIRDMDEWYAIVNTVEEDLEPIFSSKPTIGIDRGITLMIADSDGRTVKQPHFYTDLDETIKRAQRKLTKKKRGSKNSIKAGKRVGKLLRRVARQREVVLHTNSKYYADNYGTIVIEDLQITNMSASAKGTIEEPGQNVNQKSGLNRAILDMGWGKFGEQLEYKVKNNGGQLIKVPPKNTSLECPQCHHTSKDNRKTQQVFHCIECGYQQNADINAAVNIRNKGIELLRKPSSDQKPKKEKVKMNRLRRKKKPMPSKEQTVVKPTIAASGGYPACGDPLREELNVVKHSIIQEEKLE